MGKAQKPKNPKYNIKHTHAHTHTHTHTHTQSGELIRM